MVQMVFVDVKCYMKGGYSIVSDVVMNFLSQGMIEINGC